MGEFTGFAITSVRGFGLYDSYAGTIIQDRRWETKEGAEFFLQRLRPTLQQRMMVVPIRDHVLKEYRDGVEA